MRDVHGYSVVMWDVHLWLVVYTESRAWRQWFLCLVMRSLEWKPFIGCRMFVEAFLCVRHLVVVHWLAVFLTGALGQDLAGRRGDLFTGIVYTSVGRESRLRTVVCVVRLACLAIWFVRLSCFITTVVWSLHFEFFTWVLSISKVGVVVYLLSWIVDKLSIGILYYTLVYSSVIVSWAVE